MFSLDDLLTSPAYLLTSLSQEFVTPADISLSNGGEFLQGDINIHREDTSTQQLCVQIMQHINFLQKVLKLT